MDKNEHMYESKALYLQWQKDAMLPSLLYVAKKLGEVEGIISTQASPDENLAKVQNDFKHLYDNMVEQAGLELIQESDATGIGGEE